MFTCVWGRFVSNYFIHTDGKSAGQQIVKPVAIKHLSVSEFQQLLVNGYGSEAVCINFRM